MESVAFLLLEGILCHSVLFLSQILKCKNPSQTGKFSITLSKCTAFSLSAILVTQGYAAKQCLELDTKKAFEVIATI